MNWEQRIDRAAKVGRFTAAERQRARSWASCAVGEHRDEYRGTAVPRKVGQLSSWKYMPADPVLSRLGVEFFGEVMENRAEGARAIHRKIQRRLANLPTKYAAVPA